jgi:hypothetical protein
MIILTGPWNPAPENHVSPAQPRIRFLGCIRYSEGVKDTPAKVTVTARIAKTGRDEIDKLAAREGLERSDMVRVMLAYAHQKMPPKWRPKGFQPSTYGQNKVKSS